MENCTNMEEVNVNTFLPTFANLKPPSIKLNLLWMPEFRSQER